MRGIVYKKQGEEKKLAKRKTIDKLWPILEEEYQKFLGMNLFLITLTEKFFGQSTFGRTRRHLSSRRRAKREQFSAKLSNNVNLYQSVIIKVRILGGL